VQFHLVQNSPVLILGLEDCRVGIDGKYRGIVGIAQH